MAGSWILCASTLRAGMMQPYLHFLGGYRSDLAE
jgi:hypothetical protein